MIDANLKYELLFHKWHEKFREPHRNTQKFWNLHFEIFFYPRYIMLSWKTTQEFCVMTLNGDAIFKEKLTGGLKNDIRNLVHFHESSLFFSIAHKCPAKKAQKRCLPWMKLKSDQDFDKNLTFSLKNDMKNLVNFKASSGKSENLHFEGLLFSKVCNVWAEKIQRSCVV